MPLSFMGEISPKIGGVMLFIAVLFLLAPGRPQLLDHFPHHDEALAILLGRAVLADRPCDGACAQHTGSVLLHPVAAAIGDRWAGLYGARLVSIGFGFILLGAVIVTGRWLMGEHGGWLSGAILLVQAPFLYVSRMALYDVVAAAFLGVAVACVVAADQHRTEPAAGWWLVAGAVSLAAASLAKYVTVVYLPVFVGVVAWRFRLKQSLWCFVLPLVLVAGWYVWDVLWSRLPAVLGQLENVTQRGQAGFHPIEVLMMLGRWLFWPMLFALVGISLTHHVQPRNLAVEQPWPSRGWWMVAILMALPIPLVHLVTGGVQGLNKNMVQPLIFLAPVAACGLLRFTQPFRMKRSINAQWLLVGVILSAMVWGALRERWWLEHQYPDLGPVVEELQRTVTPNTMVMTDTDALYRYALEGRLPDDHIVLTYWVGYNGLGGEAGALRFVEDQRPDYIILDGYYGQAMLHQRLRTAMGEHYQLRHRWAMPLSWGQRTVELYERKGAIG
jgi:4-amino-4-deoxy-L-arabinose transferase-like glycosyltransferase